MDEIINAAKEGTLTLADDGTLSDEQRSLLLSFCDAVSSKLAARLRPGISPTECANSFRTAVMLEAVELFRGAIGAQISRFEAAGVAVQLNSASGMAERLLAPWLRADGADSVAFLGVRA